MIERFEGVSEKEAEKEVLLTDKEVEYLRALIGREHAAQFRAESPEEKSLLQFMESLLGKLG